MRANPRRLRSLPLFDHRSLLFLDSRTPATSNPPSLELDGVRHPCCRSPPVRRPRPETAAAAAAQAFHADAIKKGSVRNASVGNYVLAIYAKTRKLDDARKLFDVLPERDVRA